MKQHADGCIKCDHSMGSCRERATQEPRPSSAPQPGEENEPGVKILTHTHTTSFAVSPIFYNLVLTCLQDQWGRHGFTYLVFISTSIVKSCIKNEFGLKCNQVPLTLTYAMRKETET